MTSQCFWPGPRKNLSKVANRRKILIKSGKRIIQIRWKLGWIRIRAVCRGLDPDLFFDDLIRTRNWFFLKIGSGAGSNSPGFAINALLSFLIIYYIDISVNVIRSDPYRIRLFLDGQIRNRVESNRIHNPAQDSKGIARPFCYDFNIRRRILSVNAHF